MTVVTTDVAVGVDALRRGELVAFPTETVYGLGADASRPEAVARIFAVKGRPPGHPLIVHLATGDQVAHWARLDHETERRVGLLAERFWPGPLTIVVPRSPRAASATVGGRATIGLRVPDHPVALELLRGFGGGVAAPSANRFGRVSPTLASHVVDDLGGLVDVVIDGGPTRVGIESTIVELVGSEPVLLRPGAIGRGELGEVLGVPVLDGRGGESRAPGMLASHYAPHASVELVTAEDAPAAVAAAVAARPTITVGAIAPLDLSHQPSWRLPARADGYAAGLYRALREADRMGVDLLLIAPPTEGPMVAAVVDRLTKAAAPRR